MKNLTIALIQCNSPVGKKSQNLADTLNWVKKAKDNNADLVCFPELNITGHAGHPSTVSEAEEIPAGSSCQTLVKLAAEFKIFIAAGICEEEQGIHYNTQFIVGPNGFVGKQRKVHLSNDEYFYFRHGSNIRVFDVGKAKVGIIICYDNLLPEFSRCLAIDGAELLLCPHAVRFGPWPAALQKRQAAVKSNKESWRLIHRARAYDNGCYVALCNAAGRAATELPEVRANHAGGCMVIDPDGKVIAESKSKDIADEMLTCELKGEPVAKRRSQVCFNLQTRRTESFGALIRPTE